MASNDIKSTHDDNPTGADDITSDYYFQVVKDDSGTVSDEGMSVPQLRSILQITPGVPQDTFSMSIPPNTLNAVVGQLSGNYTHWQILETDVEPIYTDTSWNAWPMPTLFNVADDPDVPVLADWSTKTWHLYTKDTSTVHTILNQDGVNGTEVTPSDTIPPPKITDFAIDGALDYSFTSSADTGSGSLASPYRLHDLDTSFPIGDFFSAQAGSFAAFLPVRAEDYNLAVEYWDNFNNFSESNPVEVTVSAAADTSLGWEFDSIPGVAEDSTTLNVKILIPGGSAIDGSVTVSTKSDTAVSAEENATYGQYDEIDGTSVDISIDDTEKTVALALNDTGAVFDNNKLFLYIDHGSGDNDGFTVTREVCVIYLDSSASGGLIGFQPKASTPFDITFETTNSNVARTNSIASGQTADQFEVSVGAPTRSSGGSALEAQGSANDYDDSDMDYEAPKFETQIAITAAMLAEASDDMFQVALRTKVNSTARQVHFEFPREIATVGAHDSGAGSTRRVTLSEDHGYVNSTNEGKDVFIAGVTGLTDGMHAVTTAGTNIFDIPNAGTDALITPDAGTAFASGDSTLLEFESPSMGSIHWEWEQQQGSSDQVDFFCDTAGTYTFRCRMADSLFGLDKISIWPQVISDDPDDPESGTSSDGNDADFGWNESTYLSTVGGTGDNPDTNTDPYYPEPTDGAVAPTYSPADAASTTATPVILLTWPSGYSNLEVNEFTVTNPGDAEQVYSSRIIGPRTLEIRPTGLTEGITYTVNRSGRILTDAGVPKNINGTSTFTVQSVSNFLYSLDLSSYSSQVPLRVTESIWRDIFGNAGGSVINPGQMWIVEDPVDGSSAPPVLRVDFREGAVGLGGPGGQPSGVQGNIARGTGGDEVLTEEYVAYDIYFPPGFIHPKQMKGIRSISDAHVAGGGVIDHSLTIEAGVAGNNSWLSSNGISINNPYGPDPTQYVVLSRAGQPPNYLGTRHHWPNNIADDPPSGLNMPSSRTYYGPTNGSWHQLERRAKLNTASGSPPATADGIVQLWFNGVLRLDIDNYVFRQNSVSGQTDGFTKTNMMTWLGGSGSDFRCPQDQSAYWRNIKISKTRITG